jgi:hypothetical protein
VTTYLLASVLPVYARLFIAFVAAYLLAYGYKWVLAKLRMTK